jgi:hypothetical protein
MQHRRALTREVTVRYRTANKAGKKRILDEFTASTAYHRKYAISLLSHEGKSSWYESAAKRSRPNYGITAVPGGNIRKPTMRPF